MSVSPLRHRDKATGNVVPLERPSTKDLLIETGELLYGQHGFNGISLREIAAVAGQRNCNAVQYHFKNKFGFVSAILADRVSRLDALRARHFAELTQETPGGDYAPRDLLKVIWAPDLTILGPDHTHAYIRFSLQYYLQPDAGAHPFYERHPETGWGQATPLGQASCLFQLTNLLRNTMSHIRQETFDRRIGLLSMMYQCSVVEHDNAHALGSRKKRPAYDADAVIDMAIGALRAPD
jgi:AcrR family transcriptional regulator